ncbi:MAG: 5'-3' exonuclease H3TH domain-containing protein [Pseudomonadota bacterium]
MRENNVFILVDGSSYLYRAFHALPELTTRDGLQTGAIKGVSNMLRKLVDEYQPSLMAVVFDAKGKTFRDDLYPKYKANRPPMPDDMREQIEPLHDLVRAMGLPLLSIPGVEADDVIGTLAVEAAKAGQNVLISTGDKDMAQLVDDNVTLINTMSGTLMDPDGVVEKFGVRADQIIDYLALVGDTADNIPGVHKCGPKTAAKWLGEFDTMQGVIDNADSIKGKIGEYLREAIEHLPLSYELATIKLDVELDSAFDELAITEPAEDDLIELLTRLEFKTWLREVCGDDSAITASRASSDSAVTTPEAPGNTNYETVLTGTQLQAWIEKLEAAGEFAFDTETTDLDYMKAEVVGLSFACTPGEAAYVPVAHSYDGAPGQLGRDYVLNRLRPLLESDSVKKIGQNLKYDYSVLLNHGVEMRGISHDTLLESFVLDSTAGRHDMDSLAKRHLDVETVHFEDIAGKGKNQLTFDQIEIEKASHYAAEDADITLQLHSAIWPKLNQIESLTNLYQSVELPLVDVLSRIERNGVKIDPDMLFAQSHEIAERLGELERDAFDEAGEEFNLGSPKQIQEIFFEKNENGPGPQCKAIGC